MKWRGIYIGVEGGLKINDLSEAEGGVFFCEVEGALAKDGAMESAHAHSPSRRLSQGPPPLHKKNAPLSFT